jgi:RNA polymerase sigma-70 factor, ECF subfamily
MSDSAEQLCRRAKAGDMSAASELVSAHYQRIYAYFRRLCGRDDDAADLTQKTFSKVWTALPTFEGRSSFSAWIHGIGHHVYVDWRRKGDRLDPQPDEWWETCAADGPTPFEDAEERDLAGQLHALVARLDDTGRQVVHLHYYQELSLAEIADVLDISPSTVKYRLREALNFLKAQPERKL